MAELACTIVIIERRHWPIRRLTADEVERLGYGGRLQLSRVQMKSLFWRNTKWFVVETPRGEARMTVTKKELAAYDIHPDG